MTNSTDTTEQKRNSYDSIKQHMKKQYFIGVADQDWSDNRWEYKGGWGLSPKRRKGYIGLWDRNCYRFWWFKIIRKTSDKYGWIVEREPNFGSYWKQSIKEI